MDVMSTRQYGSISINKSVVRFSTNEASVCVPISAIAIIAEIAYDSGFDMDFKDYHFVAFACDRTGWFQFPILANGMEVQGQRTLNNC